MKEIYLDNAATTKARKEVVNYMVDCMEHSYANADSIHNLGLSVAKKINENKKVFEKLGLPKDSIYFTAGGGEANNILIKSVCNKFKKGRIISTPIEHPSIIKTLESLKGFDVCYLKVDEYGRVDENSLKELLNEDTILVTIAYVNSELGTIQDIPKLCRITKEKNKDIVFHTDFVQGLGHVKVDFSKIPVDAVSFSSHKIYGPKGVGAIYISKKIKLQPVVYGSNSENAFVPRTLANEQVLGFLKAISLLDDLDIEHLREIKEYTLERLKEIPNIRINSPEFSSPGLLNVSFIGARGEIIMNYLSSMNIYVSTGSACSVKKGPSSVIKAIGLEDKYSSGVIRLSFGRYNTKEDIDEFITQLNIVLGMIRSVA